MMAPMISRTVGALAALLLLGSFLASQSLTLVGMLAQSDGGIVGRIESRTVRSVDAGDGAPIYFTMIRITGTDLATGEPRSVDVVFAGGFIDKTHGTFNASAPAADETRVGRQVLAFHKHTENIAGGLAGNLLTGARAGLFTTFESRKGATIVQGRGRGHAVTRNVKLQDLRARAREIIERQSPPR